MPQVLSTTVKNSANIPNLLEQIRDPELESTYPSEDFKAVFYTELFPEAELHPGDVGLDVAASLETGQDLPHLRLGLVLL